MATGYQNVPNPSANTNNTAAPVHVPITDQNGNLSQAWTLFLTSLQSKAAAVGPVTTAPTNATTPVTWLTLQAGGQTYKIPLHQ